MTVYMYTVTSRPIPVPTCNHSFIETKALKVFFFFKLLVAIKPETTSLVIVVQWFSKYGP